MRSRTEVEQLLEAVRAVKGVEIRCEACGKLADDGLEDDMLALEDALCWVLQVPRATEDTPDDISPLTLGMSPAVQALVREVCAAHPVVLAALDAGRETVS